MIPKRERQALPWERGLLVTLGGPGACPLGAGSCLNSEASLRPTARLLHLIFPLQNCVFSMHEVDTDFKEENGMAVALMMAQSSE